MMIKIESESIAVIMLFQPKKTEIANVKYIYKLSLTAHMFKRI